MAAAGDAEGNLPPEVIVEGALAVHLEHAALALQAAMRPTMSDVERASARAGVALRSSRLATTPAARVHQHLLADRALMRLLGGPYESAQEDLSEPSR